MHVRLALRPIDLQLPPKVRHAQAYGDVFAVGGVVSRVES